MKSISNIISELKNRFFKSVVSRNLIYNSCWEDPRLDRELLQLDTDSRVVMLTSAGCNALDYLLDAPHRIHCVDINPAQNALLELKKALFKHNNYPLLWDMFGEGSREGVQSVYHKQIRRLLPLESQKYWDQKINYFAPDSASASFYFRGTSGTIAKLIFDRIQHKGLFPRILKMLNAESLEEQAYYFEEVEPRLWNTFSKWLVRQHATMTMLGVPSSQQDMIREEYRDGMLHFIRHSLREVFTERPLRDNYFWRVYLTGSYSRECCPNYLLESNFEQLRKRIDNITTHNCSLLQFLQHNPGPFTHFILLDHQDWLAHAQPKTLEKEWNQILSQATGGTRILFRSADSSLEFLPDFVFQNVTFQPEITKSIHQLDRVGTYESTHLAIVQ